MRAQARYSRRYRPRHEQVHRYRLRLFFPVSESDLQLFAAYARNPLRNWVIVLSSAKAGLRAGETALGFAAALCKSRIPTQTADASLLRCR
jgi:hypothetical protein